LVEFGGGAKIEAMMFVAGAAATALALGGACGVMGTRRQTAHFGSFA
jgi:hypothetical protein